jgi:hypothetical protein
MMKIDVLSLFPDMFSGVFGESILKKAKRIAVVGLSDNPARTSYRVSQVMQNAGYDIIPVNPTIDEVLGVKAVATLKDIEGHIAKKHRLYLCIAERDKRNV